jgi:hypothetical protein
MNPSKNQEQPQHEKIGRNKLKVIRFAVLRWWKKKRTFYINVQQSEVNNNTNSDHPYGASIVQVVGTMDDDSSENYEPKQRVSNDSSSSSSSSYMDVTSVSSNGNRSKHTIQPTSLLDTTNILNNNKQHQSDRSNISVAAPLNSGHAAQQSFSSDEVFLSRPVPFTPRRSYSSASLQSMDSLTESYCWDPNDNDEDTFVELNNNTSESFPFFTTSIGSTDMTSANLPNVPIDFFAEHIQFLRNQTQPQHVHEFKLTQSRESNDDLNTMNPATNQYS